MQPTVLSVFAFFVLEKCYFSVFVIRCSTGTQGIAIYTTAPQVLFKPFAFDFWVDL